MQDPYEFHLALPGEELPPAYFACRFATLREPLGASSGSEFLEDDGEAVHAWFEHVESGLVVAVGRAHFLKGGSSGGGADHAGAGAPDVPGFEPLVELSSDLFPAPVDLRPAFQVRQMGTRTDHQRLGLAARILGALEQEALRIWEVRSGWLQARSPARPFYEACKWQAYGSEYDIPGVGPHRSMGKFYEAIEDADGPAASTPSMRTLRAGAIFRPHLNWDYFEHPSAPEILGRAGRNYDPALAWLLSEASMLAYSRDDAFVADRWAQVGIEHCEFFDGPGAQGHLVIGPDGAVLVFRGTERDDLDDLRTDLKVRLVRNGGGRGKVHHGFASALVEVWPELTRAVKKVGELPFFATGHSLGGALAVLAGEALPELHSIYTFGAPRVGDGDFRDAYPHPVHRLVHNNDVVPMLPPPLRYRHIGKPVFIDEAGAVRLGSSLGERTSSRISGAITDFQMLLDDWRKGRFDSIPDSRLTDHAPRNYVRPLLFELAQSGWR